MSVKPTVVVVAHDVGGSGGMELHLEEVITRMKEAANVIVVAASMKLKDPAGVRFIRIPVMDRPAPIKIVLFSILASLRILFIKRDLLHTTGAIIFNRSDVSTVHFCHAGYMRATGDTRSKEYGSLLRRWNSSIATKLSIWMEKAIYHPKRTKRLVAVSKRVQDEVLGAFPYSAEEVSVIPNGVNVDFFYPYAPHKKQALRLQYGLPEQGRLLLFMGGDWPRKGLDLVLEAYGRVADEFPDTWFLIVGKGDQSSYEGMISPEHKVRVRFVGKQSNPQDWFGMSDVFVFPTSYETFSLVVHEAAAAGLTIITTKVGGVEDLIEDRVNGFIVERNTVSIVQVLREALLNQDSLVYGERARRQVEQLTWDHTYSEFIKLYGILLKGQFKDFIGSRGLEVEHTHS